jgi:hypothetical protein
MFVAVPEDKKQPISQLEEKIKSQPGEKKNLDEITLVKKQKH